jgi:serine/threonine protein kinase
MTLEQGVILNNRYRIVEVLAQGGMGSVYRATDIHLGIGVAVKENLFASGGYARQFHREGMILAQLRHPSLPRVTDQFMVEGQGQYLVMDYIEGEDLRHRLERMGVIPEEEVVAIGAVICDALEHLNSQVPPIVHRDIKPGNVKITPEGLIYLVDFGLAKKVLGEKTTTTGARAMTPGYSPPEQYGTARTDHRSDIFSLGATLYATLTGVIPDDPISRAMDQAELTPVRKLNEDISADLAAIVEKALAIDPEERYQSAAAFKTALLNTAENVGKTAEVFVVSPAPFEKDETHPPLSADDYFDEDSISVSSETSQQLGYGGLISGLKKRSSSVGCWMFGIIALILVVIGGFGFYNFIPRNQTEAPSGIPALDVTQTFQHTSTQGGTASPLPNGVVPDAEITRGESDQASLIPSSTTESSGEVHPSSTQISQDTGTTSQTEPPLVQETPLGGGYGRVAFASDRGGNVQIYIKNVDGTDLIQITDIPGGACQPDFSPDNDRLAFISPCTVNKDSYPGSAIFTINIDGTGLTPIPTVPGGDFDPAWSPDGTKIAFTSLRENGKAQIYTYNFEDKSVSNLSKSISQDKQPDWSTDGRRITFTSERLGIPQIWVMDADGENQKLFTKSTAYINTHPSWSPDGQSILFTQLIADGGIPRLAVAPFLYEDYEEFRFTQESSPMREGRYSPDGFWIVFEGWLTDSNQNLFILAANGALREQLTFDPSADFDPTWSPP